MFDILLFYSIVITLLSGHPVVERDPGLVAINKIILSRLWIPAFAGMTKRRLCQY